MPASQLISIPESESPCPLLRTSHGDPGLRGVLPPGLCLTQPCGKKMKPQPLLWEPEPWPCPGGPDSGWGRPHRPLLPGSSPPGSKASGDSVLLHYLLDPPCLGEQLSHRTCSKMTGDRDGEGGRHGVGKEGGSEGRSHGELVLTMDTGALQPHPRVPESATQKPFALSRTDWHTGNNWEQGVE